MTNAESKLAEAIEAKNNGKLNDWENEFVSQFEDFTKKQLKSLTYKQYVKLRDIADKNQ